MIKAFILILFIGSSTQFECGESEIGSKIDYNGEGKTSSAKDWPWLAALFEREIGNELGGKYFCGATLISEKTLISARHCLVRGNNEKIAPPKVKAVLGRHNIYDEFDPHGIVRNFSAPFRFIPVDTSAPKSQNDIAILIMSEAVNFTDYIKPICLPSISFDLKQFEGVLAGYGMTSNLDESASRNISFYRGLKTMSDEKCSEYDSKRGAQLIVSSQSFCGENKKATICKGDSGSGFYIYQSKKWVLLGIASHSFNVECKVGTPAVFVRVFNFNNWIIKNANETVYFANEFRCEKGRIITFAKKCDGKYDCGEGDNSDEDFCVDGDLKNNTFAVKNTTITSAKYTIKQKQNDSIKTFLMKDNRKTSHLPIRVAEIFPKLSKYITEWCGIEKVYRENFVTLTTLETLSLTENKISFVEEDAFVDLAVLRILSLKDNLLTSLHSKTFSFLKKLQSLDLSGNYLTSLEPTIFDNLEDLKVLKIRHNEIENLHLEAFKNLHKIEEINLFGNEIKNIDNEMHLKGLHLLRVLDLEENKCFNEKFEGEAGEEITKFNNTC